MTQAQVISQLARTLRSLESVVPELALEALNATEREQIIAAKYFKPEQDERIAQWFTKFLSVRGSLWEIIDQVH